MDHRDPLARDAVGREHVGDGARDRDNMGRPAPEAAPAEREVDSSRGDERPARDRGAESGQCNRVRVVRVHQSGRMPQLGDDRRQHARVESHTPRHRAQRHTVPRKPGRELGPVARHHDLFDVAQSRKLAREEPDLALATSPLAARRDVDDAECHASRATAASRVRSSARLNGLWR